MEISQSQSSTEKIDRRDPAKPVDSYPEKDDRRLLIFSFQGFKIFVGRNAQTNERLVSEHKKMHKTCIWMHAHNVKGAHVVICRNGKEGPISDIVFRRGLDLAIWFSVDRFNAKDVIWSELQDVFKPTEEICGVWKTYKINNVTRL